MFPLSSLPFMLEFMNAVLCICFGNVFHIFCVCTVNSIYLSVCVCVLLEHLEACEAVEEGWDRVDIRLPA